MSDKMPGVWRQVAVVAMLAFALPLGAQQAAAQQAAAPKAGDRSGKQVVDATCASCHASGANGAPKIGDVKAWSARSKQGLSSLT
ncbi:MAG: c-type cytochrome, partial [Proteobacteria bacterium]|nr:c-type cytochrome [Pseudomonadota bacterium]